MPLESQPYQQSVARPADPLVRKKFPELLIDTEWSKFLQSLADEIDKAPKLAATVNLEDQSAATLATAFNRGTSPPGIYRINYTCRVTTAASTSSSLTFTLSWTEGGVSQSVSGAAVTGNLTTSLQSGVIIIRSDSATPISYALAYTSVGATAMQYSADLVLEELALD